MISGITQGLTPLPLECARYLWGIERGIESPHCSREQCLPKDQAATSQLLLPFSLLQHLNSLPRAGRKDKALLVLAHWASKAEAAQGDGTAQRTQRHCDLTASEVPKSKAAPGTDANSNLSPGLPLPSRASWLDCRISSRDRAVWQCLLSVNPSYSLLTEWS